MKRTPQDERIVANMQPGMLCGEGFLGTDGIDLSEIISADDAQVREMGLAHEQIASALSRACRAAMATYGTPTSVGEHLQAVARPAMGVIPCPWGHGETFPKGEIELTDTRTGQAIVFTPLSVHLIESHGFYQGRGTRYRIEPVDAAKLLALV